MGAVLKRIPNKMKVLSAFKEVNVSTSIMFGPYVCSKLKKKPILNTQFILCRSYFYLNNCREKIGSAFGNTFLN